MYTVLNASLNSRIHDKWTHLAIAAASRQFQLGGPSPTNYQDVPNRIGSDYYGNGADARRPTSAALRWRENGRTATRSTETAATVPKPSRTRSCNRRVHRSRRRGRDEQQLPGLRRRRLRRAHHRKALVGGTMPMVMSLLMSANFFIARRKPRLVSRMPCSTRAGDGAAAVVRRRPHTVRNDTTQRQTDVVRYHLEIAF